MRRQIWLFVLVGFASALGWAETARAGWFVRRSEFACERPAYSPSRYWTPTLARWWDGLRGYSLGSAEYLYADIPGEAHLISYPCQYADPATIPYGLGPPPLAVIPVHPYGTIPPGSE